MMHFDRCYNVILKHMFGCTSNTLNVHEFWKHVVGNLEKWVKVLWCLNNLIHWEGENVVKLNLTLIIGFVANLTENGIRNPKLVQRDHIEMNRPRWLQLHGVQDMYAHNQH